MQEKPCFHCHSDDSWTQTHNTPDDTWGPCPAHALQRTRKDKGLILRHAITDLYVKYLRANPIHLFYTIFWFVQIKQVCKGNSRNVELYAVGSELSLQGCRPGSSRLHSHFLLHSIGQRHVEMNVWQILMPLLTQIILDNPCEPIRLGLWLRLARQILGHQLWCYRLKAPQETPHGNVFISCSTCQQRCEKHTDVNL